MSLNKGDVTISEFLMLVVVLCIFFGYLAILIFKARLDIFKETKNEKSNHTVKFKLHNSQDDKSDE